MKRRFRLTGSANFQRVSRSGKAVRHPLLVMAYSPNETQALRIGISVGRAVGNAVQRNRIKRQLRHAFQPSLAAISPGWDILLLARKPIKDATFLQIQAALISLLQRSELVMDKNEPEIRL